MVQMVNVAYGQSGTSKATNAIGYVVLIAVNVLSNTGFFGETNADVRPLGPRALRIFQLVKQLCM